MILRIMTIDNSNLLPFEEPSHRWRFDWVLSALFRPRETFARIAASGEGVWQTPIVFLLMTALLHALIAGSIKQNAALTGQISFPPGYEYYSPEQQAQFQQAMTATSGPVFVYVLPAILGIMAVFAGWLVVAWVLQLMLTMVGGRSSGSQTLNVVAWASLPFALRDSVRIVAMFNSQQLIAYPGLSGFALLDGSSWSYFLAALLAMIDIYLIWYVILLAVGAGIAANLPPRKAWAAVLITVIGLSLVKAIPAIIAAQLSELTIIRPFF